MYYKLKRLSWDVLRGPELALAPEGYERHADGWRCAEGYAGDAKAPKARAALEERNLHLY